MPSPFISIVIPTLNEEKYLPACLESLKKQTYKNFEIIISDGGSDDKTVEIAKKFKTKILIHHETNVTTARQKGAEKACGEIIVCADADTLYPPNHLEKIVKNYQRDKKIVAVGGPGIFEKKPWWYYYYWKVFYFLETLFFRVFHQVFYLPALNLSFKKEAFQKIGGYRPYLDFGGDELDIVNRLKKIGMVYFDPKLVAFPSSRRAKIGFFRFFFHQFLYNYLLNYFLAKFFKKTVIKTKPVR